MRVFVLTTFIVLGCVSVAAGQGTRVAFGPVARVDNVSIEGGAGGVTAVAGLHTTVRISRTFGVEAEVTGAKNRIDRSYEGWFISYATDPHASREEIERLAPTARRALGYAPGAGGSIAVTARGSMTPRVSLAVKAGVSARRYLETSSYTILSIPAGVDPAWVALDHQNSAQRRTRGGLLLGMDVGVTITPRIIIGPELRFVYGGPARVGDKHREFGVGLRGAWRF